MREKIIKLLTDIYKTTREQMMIGHGNWVTKEFDDEELRDMIRYLEGLE